MKLGVHQQTGPITMDCLYPLRWNENIQHVKVTLISRLIKTTNSQTSTISMPACAVDNFHCCSVIPNQNPTVMRQ